MKLTSSNPHKYIAKKWGRKALRDPLSMPLLSESNYQNASQLHLLGLNFAVAAADANESPQQVQFDDS